MAIREDEGYVKGLAFVVEGPTERVFYHEYLQWCCLYKAVDVTQPYKSGERARNLIRNLSFDVIEERAPMDIKSLRQAVFGVE